MGAEMAENRVELSPAEEKEAIKTIMDSSEWTMGAGDKFHLISARWWKLWQGYAGYNSLGSTIEDMAPLSSYLPPNMLMSTARQRPPSIDNSDLLSQSGDQSSSELRDSLIEEADYALLPDEAWKKLHQWYGGGPDIVRSVITVGQNSSSVVEVYPLKLKMVRAGKGPLTGSRTCEISRQATVKDLYTWSAKAFSLEEAEFRLWDFFDGRKVALLSNPEATLEEAKIQMTQKILVEERKDGIWPDDSEKQGSNGDLAVDGDSEAGPSAPPPPGQAILLPAPKATTYIGPQTRNRNSTDSDGWFGSPSTSDGPKGLTGLSNLGNTCFMNSALQCLTHTPQLVDYFLQEFSKEINRTNPLGMKGELAIAFGDLLRKLWAGNRSPVAPRNFKQRLAHFAPQFSGYNQHDSQELLAFLLDGLHEDLNRVKKKPYIEAKDSDGRPDQVVADEAWEIHKARNDSVIVDVCQGQYKSTLVCPKCGKTSITFDPFMYLSLPLPDKTTRSMTVTVYSGEGLHAPQEVTVALRKSGRMQDVHQEVAKKLQLRQDEQLVFVEIFKQKVWQWVDLTEYSAQVKHDDLIAAMRVPKGTSASQFVLVSHVKASTKSVIGSPLLAPLPKEGLQSSGQLQGIVENLLRPFERRHASTSGSEETGSGPSSRDPENGAQAQSSSQELQMTEADEGDDDNGLNEATSAKSGTEHYEDAEDAETNGDDDMDDVSTPHAASTANRMSMDAVDVGGSGTTDEDPPGRTSRFHIVKSTEKDPVHTEELPSGPFPSSAVRGIYDSSRYPAVTILWTDEDLARYDMDRCVPPATFERQESSAAKPRNQTEISLASCLESFLKEEPLGVDDMWYCPTCKEHRQASKKLDLWRLPEVLVVHLKRFSYTRWLKSKLDTFVDFPMEDLDLAPYSAGPSDGNGKYELFAVSNHYGGMGGGHYTANAKVNNEWYNFDNSVNNEWYNFDDSHVSSTSASNVRSSSAYVLFYRRKHSMAHSIAEPAQKQLDQHSEKPDGIAADGEMIS